jgi:hypothetical protein
LRLSDHIQAERGGENDVGGMFTSIADALLQAERFELSDDVAKAAYQLTMNKPTSLLKALPLCRAPHRKMWIEWRGGLTSEMMKREHKRDPLIAPDPLKQGCLVETDESGQRGTMTFCWVHKERPDRIYSPVNIAPLGTLFDWSENADIIATGMKALKDRHFDHLKAITEDRPTKGDKYTSAALMDHIIFSRHAKEMSDDQLKDWMNRSVFHDWKRFAHQSHERAALKKLAKHATPWIIHHAAGFFTWCADHAMESEHKLRSFLNDVVAFSWEKDIEGEPPFIDTVIAMMNSRNAIENRPVDLSALNKQRIKKRKPPFLPYQTTHLRLSQAQTRAFRAGLISREEARHHSVRGHFKIRTTGVYWWSPFFRGDPTRPMERQAYVVGDDDVSTAHQTVE